MPVTRPSSMMTSATVNPSRISAPASNAAFTSSLSSTVRRGSAHPGGPAGGHALAFSPVGGVGALAVRGGGRVLALEVQRLGQTVEHLAGGGLGERGLERAASGGGVAVTQRRPALLDKGGGHQPMMAAPTSGPPVW
jgi:hypothetical protein